MKHTLTTVLLVGATLLGGLQAQAEPTAGRVRMGANDCANCTELANTISPRHTNIGNFDYAIALPNTGYKQTNSSLVTIFKNEASNATILVKQYGSINEAWEKTEGDTAVYYKINGTTAEMLLLKKKGTRKLTLSLWENADNGTSSPLVIEATCEEADTRTANQLERCLLSVVYSGPLQKNKETYETSAFSIANAGFKQQHSGLFSTIFTQSGDYENELKQGKQVFFQLLRQNGSVEKGQQKKNAIKQVNNAYTGNNAISKPQKVTINGMNGFEFLVTELDEAGQTKAKGYAVVLYASGAQYLFASKANHDADKNLQIYKQTARTLINK